MAQRDWMNADVALSAAIEIDADEMKFWLNRAISRWRLGRAAEAIGDLDQAAKLDEDWMLQATLAELRSRIEASEPRSDATHATADIGRP